MSDIFGGVEPPAWLQRMTGANKPGLLGEIVGQLVGGLANSAEDAISSAQEKRAQGIDTNWIKELPANIKPGLFEARMNIANPMWRMQAQQAQLNLAQQGLQMQNTQSMIDSRKTALRLQGQDQETFSSWMQDHPTWESRQDATPPQLFTPNAQRMYRDVQLGDAADVKHKAVVSGIDAFAKSVDELSKLNPTAAAPFAVQIGRIPTPQMQGQLEAALQKERDKAAATAQPRGGQVTLPDGTTVNGIFEPQPGGRSTFKPYVDPDAAARNKAQAVKDRADESRKSSALREEEIYARERVTALEKALNEAIDPKRKEQLTNEWLKARKYFNSVLDKATKAGESQTAPAAAAPAPTFNPNDPLGLGIK